MEDQEGFLCLNPQSGSYVVKDNFFEPSSRVSYILRTFPQELIWVLFGAVHLENQTIYREDLA